MLIEDVARNIASFIEEGEEVEIENDFGSYFSILNFYLEYRMIFFF